MGQTFGLLSAALSVLAFLPYIADTLRRRTRPHRTSWFIWWVLSALCFAAQAFEGATASLWFSGAQVAGTGLVALLSIRYGVGGTFCGKDCVILSIAGAGLVAWLTTENAAYALAISIAISLLGGLPTIHNAHRQPSTETTWTWALYLVGAGCAAVSVGETHWLLLAYPAYIATLSGAILVALALSPFRMARHGSIASI